MTNQLLKLMLNNNKKGAFEMISKELSEAAVEINSIFENMSIDLLNKIPKNLQDFFCKIASTTYTFNYDKFKTLKEQNLKPETQGIIALIYSNYLCPKE